MKKAITGDYIDFEPITEKASYYRSIGLKEVSSLNIFKSSTTVFDENGLFSTEIFGPVDSELRFKKNGFIFFKLEVFHPNIYKNIVALGDKYRAIMAGEKNAVFNKTTKDFDLVSEDGETGFDFFVKHYEELQFPRTDSKERDNRIEVVKRYGKKSDMIDSFLVIAAGLRDYTVDSSGKPSEDEINTIYRRLIYFSQNLKSKVITKDVVPLYDGPRYSIQLLLLELYEYIKILLDGKKKFVQGNWSSRSVDYATRNVVSGMKNVIKDIDVPKEGRISANSVAVGLFQFYKSIGNIGANKFHSVFSRAIIEEDIGTAYLYNPKTLTAESVKLEEKVLTRYTTLEGFDAILNDFSNTAFMMKPMMIKGRYCALKYETTDEVKVFLPRYEPTPDIDKSKLVPMTMLEIMYICVLDILHQFGSTTTRYPIANYGSIIPSKIYVKTTTNGLKKTVKVGYTEQVVYEYPDLRYQPFRTTAPHVTHLKAFTMDFDGDTASQIAAVTREGNEEIDKILSRKEYYLGPTGEAAFSVSSTGMLDPVLRELSKTNGLE